MYCRGFVDYAPIVGRPVEATVIPCRPGTDDCLRTDFLCACLVLVLVRFFPLCGMVDCSWRELFPRCSGDPVVAAVDHRGLSVGGYGDGGPRIE